MPIILVISIISQVSVDLVIAYHVWQAHSHCPKYAAGLEYISKTYPYGPVAETDIMGTSRWRLMIEFLMLLDCMLENPPWWMSQLASFLH